MAIIRLKRITADFDPAAHKLLQGELGITGESLIYGSMGELPDGNGKVVGRQVATQNFDNLFTALNTFQSNSKTISLQNAGGTEMYKASGGRLIASRPPEFSFNENDLVDRKYVDDNIKAADALILKGTVNASTGIIASSDANIDGKRLKGATDLLTGYRTGWTFKVSVAGNLTDIGVMQVGDMVVAMNDAAPDFLPSDFHAFQTNVEYSSIGSNLAKIPDVSAISFVRINANETVDAISATTLKTDLSLDNVDNKSSATIRSEINSANVINALGYTPVRDARTITINGTVQDLTANRSWNVGTVTSVSGTTNQISVATGTTTPVLSIPTTFVAPGTIQSTGAMSVGSGSAAWSINGSGTDVMLFKAPGGRSITLLGGTGNKTIAFTDDIPSTTGIFNVNGSTEARTVTVPNFTLESGAQLFLKFLSASSAGSTLAINGGTAYPIHLNGTTITAGAITTNEIVRTYFDGAKFIVLENFATRQYYGNAATATLATSAGSASTAIEATRSRNLVGGNGTTLLGSIPYQSGVNATTLLEPNTETTKKFLSMTGTGTNGAIPNWTTISAGDVGALSNSTSSTQPGYFGNINLYDDSSPSHYLEITNSANLTAKRTLSINVNNADRTISLGGSLSTASSLTTVGAYALTLTTSAVTNATIPSGTVTLMDLGTAQSVTGVKTFNTSTLRMKGSSTGHTTFSSKNSSANNYTISFKAANGTVAFEEDIPDSFTISASSNILVATSGANSTSYNVATSAVAGKFFRHATALPAADTGTETTPVKYGGWLYATRFEGLIDGGTSW